MKWFPSVMSARGKKNIKPAFKVLSRASEMAQWFKVLAFQPDDLSSVPHMIKV